MKFPLYFALIVIGLVSCTEQRKTKTTLVSKIDHLDKFAVNFKENYSNTFQFNSKDLDTFYSLNSHKSIWINDSLQLNNRGEDFIKIISNARAYGLDPKKYSIDSINVSILKLQKLNKIGKRIDIATLLEKQLTKSYFKFGKHLNYGIIENIDSLTTLTRKEFTIDLPKYLEESYKKDSVINYLLKLQPQHEMYQSLQKGLETYLQNASFSKANNKVISFRIDSVQSYKQARNSLVLHNYLSENSNEIEFDKALKKFQKDHGLKPDGVIGKNTAIALSKSPYYFYQSAAVSLERWRWKQPWKEHYIFVNIPSYKLRINLHDTLQLEQNVVVGKIKNKTPEVYSKLSYLVAYPYWHVPKSISVNEILIKAQKDSSYIKRNSYEVFTNQRERVDTESINWEGINRDNFNFYIRQKGGSSNALGLVKFIFANKYSIYLHDTPTKYHFQRELRAYSHGCVRVQNALEVAKHILEYDNNQFTIDSINSYVSKRREKKMMLEKKLPIYIQYITCETDQNNRIIFYHDIYNKDKDLMKIMFND